MNRRNVLSGLALAGAAPAHAAREPGAASQMGRKTPSKDCVALITGSNRGIGLGFVEALLARGAKRIYATGRTFKNLEPVVALDPKRIVPLELDITNDAHRRAAAAKATDVTWLINNAAYPGIEANEERRFRTAKTLDDARKVMDTNCWSQAEMSRALIPHILKNGGGAIVQILSVGALFCLPEFSTYCASKAAAAIMNASLRADLDKDPVLVASVYTGGVKTRVSPGVGSNRSSTPMR